jgi:Xaa-Pro dipeptidase
MRQAADIAQRALLATLPQIKIGMTEKELASELVLQILRAGSGPELPFAPIVSAGPNAANPHAAGSLRPLQPGDLLVIDWGASYEDYYSDITRTFAVGEISEEMEQVYQLVKAANRAGREAVHPGVTADQVDAAARQVIEEGGYGKYFIHRTGHGLGMEAHEPPYIRQGNETVLEPGMTFTIEPGIYLPGRNGVRIEDDVLVTDQGSESLTDLPRELETVG